MNWVEIKKINGKIDQNSLPQAEGKYVIETKTLMGSINRFQARFNGSSFDFSNQILLRWLNEN